MTAGRAFRHGAGRYAAEGTVTSEDMRILGAGNLPPAHRAAAAG